MRNITTRRITSTIITQLAPAGTTKSTTPTSNTAVTTQKSETEETTGTVLIALYLTRHLKRKKNR